MAPPIILLAAVFAAEFAFQSSHLDFNSLRFDESQAIFMGRHVLGGTWCSSCEQHTGSVYIHPVLTALGHDGLADWFGHWGGRMVSVFFGLVTTLLVYGTARYLFDRWVGLIAAVILALQAPFLYISKVGLYDIVSTTFLALSAFSIVLAGKQPRSRPFALMAAGIALGLGAVAKYATAVYVPVGLLLVGGWLGSRALVWFVPALGLVLGYFGWIEIWPHREMLGAMATSTVALGQIAYTRADIFALLVQWLIWIFALSLTGFLDRERRAAVGVLFLLAFVQPLTHLISGGEQALHKNLVQSMFFLAPAAGVGIKKTINQLFRVPGSADLRWLGHGFLIVLLGLIMIRDLSWLERQYPNTDPAVAYLSERVTPQNVIFAEEEAIFGVYLDKKISWDRLFGTYHLDYNGSTGLSAMKEFVRDGIPDYIVFTGYGTAAQNAEIAEEMGDQYRLGLEYDGGVSWGKRMVHVYERRPAEVESPDGSLSPS